MKVDMSAKAVTARLKRVSQLRDLARSLGKAKLIQPKPSEQEDSKDNTATSKTNESTN